MRFYLVTVLYLLFFLIRLKKDKGNLINGFLFFVLMLLSGLCFIRLADTTGSRFLLHLATAIAVLITIVLLSGTFTILLMSFGSAYVLLKREGRSLSNLLSLFLGIGIIGWLLLNTLSFQNTSMNKTFSAIMLVLNTVLFYLVFMFSNFLLASFVYRIYYPIRRQDYIIVLGAGLIHGDKVSPLLAGRIDRAIKVYRKQLKNKGVSPIIIMSGGQGPNEALPESHAMREYAIDQGIPEHHILIEDKSVNTYQNMLFSKELIESKEKDMSHTHILFSTTNYHVFRAGMYAKKVHLRAQGIGAKTKFYFWYNALLREFAAILVMNKRTHIICVIFLLVIIISSRALIK
ncbi:YdcF family protein [Blautia liquoris]|jgi:uncharacterized SAM-binding protein YcdF (DUF218 family)|uniref:YdcF family protein n=1 Tax=Blautia liquoris TaxID=2779518 RepID=A0A7M2RI19_9FIRM|nr:YdcF family protein [Blautia liquoris]QOV19187.1 YdcF family protein [Blautia liquoris]